MADEQVTQQAEYAIGCCPKCGKTRVDVANGITNCCGHNLHAAGSSYAAHDRKTMERFVHAKTDEEKAHFGRKLRMRGYEDA